MFISPNFVYNKWIHTNIIPSSIKLKHISLLCFLLLFHKKQSSFISCIFLLNFTSFCLMLVHNIYNKEFGKIIQYITIKDVFKNITYFSEQRYFFCRYFQSWMYKYNDFMWNITSSTVAHGMSKFTFLIIEQFLEKVTHNFCKKSE